MKLLKISQIFYSIQGEGTNTGEASIFIRFFGCNLTCSFCDDLLHKDKNALKQYTYLEILDKIKEFPSKKIIITGGEPSMYDLNNFISFLQKNNYFVSIETNGYKFENITQANWITYSPKEFDNIDTSYSSEFKFIVHKGMNINHILNLKTSKPIYVQPQNNTHTLDMTNLNHCIKLVEKYPQFKLSVQLHKFLGVL